MHSEHKIVRVHDLASPWRARVGPESGFGGQGRDCHEKL